MSTKDKIAKLMKLYNAKAVARAAGISYATFTTLSTDEPN